MSSRRTTSDRRGLAEDERLLLARMDVAAEQNELSLVYQRQVAPDGVTLLGVESLLRWDCPGYGQVSPGLFNTDK